MDVEVLKTDFSPPPFVGSMLRGAFGASLKDIVCINPAKICSGCFAKENCLYYEFFEEKNRFLNFRFDFALYPEKPDFSFYLFNEAVLRYPYVLSAFYRMVTKKGLSRSREVFEIKKIKANGEEIYDGEFKNIKIEPKSFHCDNFCPKVRVKFVTPLRMKKEGKLVRVQNLEIKDVLVSICKKKAFFDKVSQEIESFPKVIKKDLKMVDFTRYSNRQRKKLKIGGIVGEMIIEGLTFQTYQLLKYGEISGVGKLNSFGLGKIELEDIK